MNIFAIADLHLSGHPPAKPMSIFHPAWEGHWDKICSNWRQQVTDQDTVLIAGDISWAMRLDSALEDLSEISALPGQKILIRGNHDYWWQTVTKMSKAVHHQLLFLHNAFAPAGEYAICGSRGWLCPQDPLFREKDRPIYESELARIEASLSAAEQAGFARRILMLHFPPLYKNSDDNEIIRLIAKYQVEICVYGHLHGPDAHAAAPTGMIGGAQTYLTACDALDFQLLQII